MTILNLSSIQIGGISNSRSPTTAKILGLDDQVGTLEVGKRANIQILTGDPLQATTWVDKVLLDGDVVYDRSKDARLQYLFGKNDTKKTKKKVSK